MIQSKRDQGLQLLNKLSKNNERVSIHFLEANLDIVKNVLAPRKNTINCVFKY